MMKIERAALVYLRRALPHWRQGMAATETKKILNAIIPSTGNGWNIYAEACEALDRAGSDLNAAIATLGGAK